MEGRGQAGAVSAPAPARYVPPPQTSTDFYLADLIEEIRGLRQDLHDFAKPMRVVTPPEGMTELREQGKQKRRS
jgi:hypothetical protein